MLFKDAVPLPPHSQFLILPHRIAPDSTSNGSNGTSQQGTGNRTFKQCIVTLSIVNNNNNAIVVGKAVNALMKVIHGIEVDAMDSLEFIQLPIRSILNMQFVLFILDQ